MWDLFLKYLHKELHGNSQFIPQLKYTQPSTPGSLSLTCTSFSKQPQSFSITALLLILASLSSHLHLFLSQCRHPLFLLGMTAIQIRENLPALQALKKNSLSEFNYFPLILQVGSKNPDYCPFYHFEMNCLIKNSANLPSMFIPCYFYHLTLCTVTVTVTSGSISGFRGCGSKSNFCLTRSDHN